MAKHYSKEFKQQALKLVEEAGRSVKQIAEELGVPFATVYGWRKKAGRAATEAAGKEPLTKDERDELNRLRRDVERLQMEREFLKKAAAFFAKESK